MLQWIHSPITERYYSRTVRPSWWVANHSLLTSSRGASALKTMRTSCQVQASTTLPISMRRSSSARSKGRTLVAATRIVYKSTYLWPTIAGQRNRLLSYRSYSMTRHTPISRTWGRDWISKGKLCLSTAQSKGTPKYGLRLHWDQAATTSAIA